MELPTFTSMRKLRPHRTRPRPSPSTSDTTITPPDKPTPTTSHPRLTTTLLLIAPLAYLLALPLLLIIELGTTYPIPVLQNTYFLRLDFSHIIPRSVPNAVLINSIARTLGLHDFYQVGLWNYCEGYEGSGQGITGCSAAVLGYWFNPVEILLEELLAGATIALPVSVVSALSLVRTASHWMSALFLTSTILTFLCIPVSLVPWLLFRADRKRSNKVSRHRTLLTILITLLTTLTTIITTAATVIATAMFVIFRNVFTNVAMDLNIDAVLGTVMFVFMWLAVGLEIVGMVMQWALCCCGRGKRKTKRGAGEGLGAAEEKGKIQGNGDGVRRRIVTEEEKD